MQIAKELYTGYLNNLLAGDRRQCRDTVVRLLDSGTGVREIYEGLFRRSMYQVGQLWETGQISVATEHLATSITEALLTLVYPYIFAAEHTDKTAVISCAANEYHQIGGRMVADTFEMNGWNGHFLGANTPVEALAGMVAEKKPDVVGFSLSVLAGLPSLLEGIRMVREARPKVLILVGGQAFERSDAGDVSRLPGVRSMTTLVELETFLHETAG